jgi:hypothetical protein
MFDEYCTQPKSPTEADTNQRLANLCNRLMESEQRAITEQSYALEELTRIAEASRRDDVLACIDEIKQKVTGDEITHWEIIKGWFTFFSGISTEADDPDGE